MSINIGEILLNLWQGSGFNAIFAGFTNGGWQNLVMLIIACVLLYLGIVKKFEPLLLVGIAFGCLLSNLPLGGLYHQELWDAFMDPTSEFFHSYGTIMREGMRCNNPLKRVMMSSVRMNHRGTLLKE